MLLKEQAFKELASVVEQIDFLRKQFLFVYTVVN